MCDATLGEQMLTGLGDLICDWSNSRSAIPVAEVQIVPGGEDTEAEDDPEAEEAQDVDPVPDPEDDAVNALLLEISELENQMPDYLPSGITAADVGHASLSIPVFYSEEDYPGPNVIELLEISEQENQMPDYLPSGITAADIGHISLSIPVFYSEEDYPGPNVIESHQEEAEVVERLFIELIEDAFDCWA